MKRNVQIIANRIATGAARHATKRRFLNAHVYTCASWALGLGLVSLLTFAGVPFGIMALTTVSRRRLPRGKRRAIAGIVLPFVGFLVTAGVVLLMGDF